MTRYRELVKAAAGAAELGSYAAYSWFGRRFRVLDRNLQHSLPPETARRVLLHELRDQLYRNFYCEGRVVPEQRRPARRPTLQKTPLVAALSAANGGQGGREGGWEIVAIRHPGYVVRRAGVSLCVGPEDISSVSEPPTALGTVVDLPRPKESLNGSPGHYLAYSDTEFSAVDAADLVRFYLNLTPGGAVDFLRRSTVLLNRGGLPFCLKAVSDPESYHRCDAVVLYIGKQDYAVVAGMLEEIYPDLQPALRPEIPALTKALAPGIGLAEDPGNGESFGRHRCLLLADGLIRAAEEGRRALDDRVTAVMERFAEGGISIDQPFLSPGSRDRYRFHPRRRAHPTVSERSSQAVTSTSDYLAAAAAIGAELMREAVWHEGRCNWMGTLANVHDPTSSTLTYETMGPDLYSGTAGIAYFLAHLYAATGDARVRRTALGAIGHAVTRAHTIPAPIRLGLYSGWPGIAFAAVRTGLLLRAEEPMEEARRLVQAHTAEAMEDTAFDLFHGRAGAVAALVHLYETLGTDPLLDLAAQVGAEVVDGAARGPNGCSWRPAHMRERFNLTGLSHGASGVAYALLELFRVTGDARFRQTAEEAFRYERQWFDPEIGNWADLRGQKSRHARSYSTDWCHGAPGIALSRLRGYEILGDSRCRSEAMIALNTTRRKLETALDDGGGNYSLCHGLAGNAAVLIEGTRVLGNTWTGGLELARQIAAAGLAAYPGRGRAWACGLKGQTPGLMLGLAGIGQFYLQVSDPLTPSALLLPSGREALNGDRPRWHTTHR